MKKPAQEGQPDSKQVVEAIPELSQADLGSGAERGPVPAPDPSDRAASPPQDGERIYDIEEEINALLAAFPDANKRFEFLYSSLSILDTKASFLMAFNAIGLTALAVWLEYVPANWLHFTLDGVFLLLLLSSAICFWVVRVYWSPPAHFRDRPLQTRRLLEMRNSRTLQYRCSWILSILAVVIFTVVSAIHMVGTSLRATDACTGRCAEFFSEKIWGNRDSQQGGSERKPSDSAPSASEAPLRSGPAGER